MKGVQSVAKPMPEDFAVNAGVMSNENLRAHYGVGGRSVQRWRKLSGVSGMLPKLDPAPVGFASVVPVLTLKELRRHYGVGETRLLRWCAEKGVTPRRATRVGHRPTVGMRHTAGLTTEAERAANFLRRFGPVYRCDQGGKPNVTGKWWSRNGYVLTDDDVIERAERQGWSAREWAMVA